jgi:hypothetical protein
MFKIARLVNCTSGHLQEGVNICSVPTHCDSKPAVVVLVTFLHVLPAVLTPTSSTKITMAEDFALPMSRSASGKH